MLGIPVPEFHTPVPGSIRTEKFGLCHKAGVKFMSGSEFKLGGCLFKPVVKVNRKVVYMENMQTEGLSVDFNVSLRILTLNVRNQIFVNVLAVKLTHSI